ncbi:sigma factor-like helix-turn-helix DNA-binding protein [Cloacibacillus porcorum]|uniref:sigma factor-like helix-turn-helix DNA-binding protein n=1 Tax=Cloacibacillus porcorum TaxID=1197717 RepID=UPI0025857ADB|nr:sigma factor-like helix-turn-helix DNA-binding protein [Cloacibacillus porcorum]
MSSYKHRMAEGAMRDFPAIKRDYEGYKLMLDARALAGGCIYDERVDGGGVLTSGDRYLERYNDPVMRDLKALLDGIYGPFSRLSAEERSVLALRYWRKLDVAAVARELTFSERNVYRVTSRALGRLYRPVLEVQGLLEDWRVGRLK